MTRARKTQNSCSVARLKILPEFFAKVSWTVILIRVALFDALSFFMNSKQLGLCLICYMAATLAHFSCHEVALYGVTALLRINK